jgi:hypothetical protein
MRDDGSVTTPGDDGWVLAVDVRSPDPLMATAGAGGVRAHVGDAGAVPIDLAAAAHRGSAPLAVVVVHPATWDAALVAAALHQVAGQAPGAGWPAPVPLTVAEAVAWRALQFGLVPARGRLAVLDPVAQDAAVVDRDGDSLAAVGAPLRLQADPDETGGPADLGVRLVAMARQALDAAPAGPPFAGVLLAAALPGADADAPELPGLIAQITGRAPLVPGDPTRAAVLGAAALGWAAATAQASETAPAPATSGVAPGSARGSGAVPAARRPPSVPGISQPRRPGQPGRPVRPRRQHVWVAAILGLLVAVAVVVGLGWHRVRTAPSPFTYTCPDGQVVAYGYECATLAPSAGP